MENPNYKNENIETKYLKYYETEPIFKSKK